MSDEATVDPGSAPAPDAVPGPKPPVVEFRNVTKTYDAGTPHAFTAIQDVTFSVAPAM